jgi:hypothetical protein
VFHRGNVEKQRHRQSSEVRVPDDDDYVMITGVAQLVDDFVAFLAINGRRFFIPMYCTTECLRMLRKGDKVTLELERGYAKQQGLID